MPFNDTGTMTVHTYTAGGALPIKNAIVRIYGAVEENRFVEYSVLTNTDGATEKITLPAPSASFSQAPAPKEIGYALYNAEVVYDGYYAKRIYDIPIFAGTDAVLPVNMIPIDVHDSNNIFPTDNLNTYIKENERLD